MICNKCHIDKEIKEFSKRADTVRGIRGTCRICQNKRVKKWWRNSIETRLKYSKEWYKKNSEKVIKQKVSSNLKRRRQSRLDCIAYYSNGKNSCGCCGEKHIQFLAIDHINGGGRKHRQSLKEYLPLVLKKQGYPKGYRILCHNCNLSYGFYGFCPHTKEIKYEKI